MALNSPQIQGGTFTGRATFSSGMFSNIAEDVSPLVSMISPAETPFLVEIGDAEKPAYNIFHEYLEEELSPNAVINSVAIASTTASTPIPIKGGLGIYLQVGMILRGPEVSGGEYMQIENVVGANTIVVSRAFAGTVANSFAIGEYLTVVADAATEGADVLTDTSKSRNRLSNYLQIFKKDIIVGGSTQAVNTHDNMDEFDRQKRNRTREALRDLEKACILGKLSGNTIGTAGAVRTMKGLLSFIATNITSITSTSYDGTFGSTQMQAFEAYVNDTIRSAWIQGGTDINVIMCGDAVKRRFDQLNNSRTQVANGDGVFNNRITFYECTYGSLRLMLNRWMPSHMMAVLATNRIAVPPLNGRSFGFVPVAKTGDADKAMIIGEYTMELRNEAGMAQMNFAALAPGAGGRLIPAP